MSLLDMPRRKPERNTVQITLKVPEHWLELADARAKLGEDPIVVPTRTDVLRDALRIGLREHLGRLVQRERDLTDAPDLCDAYWQAFDL